MLDGTILTLVVLGLVLGLRHGIDWDHLAAIADITSAQVAVGARASRVLAPVKPEGPAWWYEGREGFFLATLYALGHATVVVALGLLAIWASTLLPDWIDPIIERVVGVTLLLLGAWVFYAIWRDGRDFRLRSRWMLVFSLVARAWAVAKSRLTGEPMHHRQEVSQYGPKTAYAVGMIHGIGAETGSQALLLAGAAGATSPQAGSLMLLSFVVGLVISNSLVAAFSAFGFVSAHVKQNVYFAIAVPAGAFSLVIGALFVAGQGAALPDLQQVLDLLFGASGASEL